MHVKAIVSGTEEAPRPDLRRPQAVSQLSSRRGHELWRWNPSHGVPERDTSPLNTQIEKIAQDTRHRTRIKKITGQWMNGW